MTNVLQENLTGIRVVKAFANEKYEINKFNNSLNEYTSVWKRTMKRMSTFWGISDVLTYTQLLVVFVLSIFFILFGLKIIILKENSIYVSSDFLLGWYKVQYQEEILLDNLSFVEIKQRDYTYSSRGKEKTGRGIETRIVGNKFIEFNYSNSSIKRIYCLDLSKKQINRIMEFCKQKNIECK